MIWHRLKLTVVAGTILILAVLAAATAALVARWEDATRHAADAALERSARAVENALNRQLLQVHGALASLPTLLAAAKASPQGPLAAELLRGLNFQTLAFRDLMLVAPDGTILASARARGGRRTLPVAERPRGREAAALIGPVRNPVTGDWSIYLMRTVPGWNEVFAVAEVPVPTLMQLLAETGVDPGVRIQVERPNGQLVGSLPHDEVETGVVRSHAVGMREPDGTAFVAAMPGGGDLLAVVRASLHGNLRVVLTTPLDGVLAPWRRDSARVVVASVIGGLLVAAFAGALVLALGQRERTEEERARSAAILANAVEAMSDGFAMWDEHDRLVTCNQRYRDLFSRIAHFLTPGERFEDILRKGIEVGQYPEAAADVEAFVAERLHWHRNGTGGIERLLPDGRWVLMTERLTADGGIVGIRTDVTELKTALADLAQANARATEAAAEARRQNIALRERESRIRFLAHHDDLTGLPNRVLFRERVADALDSAFDQGGQLALLYLDLDRFKDVNDTLGHPVGDALLRAAAERLIACVASPQLVARLSGDEFAVISLAPRQPEAAEELSRRIIEVLAEPYAVLGHAISISVSVGISVAPGAGADADTLLKHADLALYQAKARGRGTHCVFEAAMDVHLRARLEMELDLSQALAKGQLELAYQPIFAVASGRLCGFEALLRWNHPRRGLIDPAAFVPLAEESRAIVEIGAWAMRRAMADAAGFPEHLRFAINLSPIQIGVGDIVATVRDALADTGVAPGRIELEITETALFAQDQPNFEILHGLRQAGVRIVLDDFGTGYSSLARLRLLPLDKIKIDRSFVHDAGSQSSSEAIIEAIAALAARLGMATTAEGIETQGQWEMVRRARCTEAQGFLLGRPCSAREAAALAAAAAAPPAFTGCTPAGLPAPGS
ncbi:bifunctional diguanylate cyclase/phosphodiesterase [Xanthobacter tagetidis]|jgi:diguanylate cyclase (GGDEF)-like protein|uniref:EAL domain-containing protein n=1 Tax=Xanthobacter tagetidis TaxID=60216 RepID=A0A3L7A242_9HYPH|nr:EAL domain-containing protein [Xanthobacter tagetidis]MBB6307208.1 diguanylate cyclase (GGDEF)-like protein [Xanthobacter tagetidis]RLP74045.1 EAL domain-containing protein [Xanthobacter tagetidis]